MIRLRWRVAIASSVIAGVANTSSSAAQSGPVFELQPGMAVSDFVSVSEGTATNTAFSLRFGTRFPTKVSWLTPVVGGVFLPYGSTENTIRNTDAPTIFAGNIFPLLASAKTGGWLSMELPVVIAHSPGTGQSGNVRDYGRDLVIFPTLYVHIGAMALREFGNAWSRLSVFGQLEQNLTPNKEFSTGGGRDFFNPIVTVGGSLKIGGVP